MSWRFRPGEELPCAFRRVAVEEIGEIRGRLDPLDSDREEAIHESRRSFKRLRALLRLARSPLGPAFDEENRRWRDSARLLAASRDATVVLGSFDAMVGRCRNQLPAAAVADLRGHIAGSPPGGGGSDGRADLADPVGQVRTMLEAGERACTELTWPRDIEDLRRGLYGSQKRLRKSWSRACDTGDPEHLHEWRKRLKDQMAQLGLFRDVVRDGLRKRLAREKKLADVLGEERDLVLLAARLSGSVPPGTEATRDRLLEAVAARRKDLRKRAFDAGRNLSSQKPKAFARAACASWRKAARKSLAKSKRSGAAAA